MANSSNKSVGHKIKYYRNKNDLTQQELADKIGVTWEMISRYERGSTSPMRRIHDISKALGITTYQLLDSNDISTEHERAMNYYSNFIPLFTSLPSNRDFHPTNTAYSYSAPRWILRQDEKSFAITTSIVNVISIQLKENGILYISPNTVPENNTLVLYWSNTNLIAGTQKDITIDNKPVGCILAQEIKLINPTKKKAG